MNSLFGINGGSQKGLWRGDILHTDWSETKGKTKFIKIIILFLLLLLFSFWFITQLHLFYNLILHYNSN